MKIVAIEELMWSYHPLPKDWITVPFDDKDNINLADILVQSNQQGSKKEKKIGHIYQYVKDSGKPWIVTESAVFRKNMYQPPHPKAYHRYSWFSYYRDEGNYNNKNSPPDRWLQIQQDQNIEIKPWRERGEYVLLILQRPGDSSLKRLVDQYGDYDTFINETIKRIQHHTDRPIVIRMHPLRQDKQRNLINAFQEYSNKKNIYISENTQGAKKLEGGDGLYKDFEDAWCVVGFNSNALTESICEGIPTFSLCPSSMAWECSNTDLKFLDSPQTFDRQQWLNNLGYCQWREDEIEQGLPWEHLKKVYKEIK
jgi:hypothetical protein